MARERGLGKSEVYREWTRRPVRRAGGVRAGEVRFVWSLTLGAAGYLDHGRFRIERIL